MSDKIEVVRCKDCIHAKKINGWFVACDLHDIRPTPLIMDDWFCADGKRKEQNDERIQREPDQETER